MLDRFTSYLDRTFKYLPYTEEANALREEMLSGLMERAEDLRGEGKTEDEIYAICIESLGDYTEAIKALKRKPFAVLKDAKFHRALLGVLCFVLACVVVYLVLGVTFNYWGKGAIVIFPAMATILYYCLSGSLLLRNVKFNRHLTSGVILASMFTIFLTMLFFLIWACGIAPKYAWVTFTYIPLFIVFAHFIARGIFRKKKMHFISYAFLIFTLVTAVYLTAGMVTGLWHPLWILFVVALLVIVIWGVTLVSNKLKRKSEWGRK